MPTHCCVPQCTKKGYIEPDGSKTSYFVFPSDKALQKNWLHAIRREKGKNFNLLPTTKVCSRHFKESDFKKTFTGRVHLKPGSVPSMFPWIRTSPRKRKAPTMREFPSAELPRVREENQGSEEEGDGKADASTQTSSDDLADMSTQTTSDISGERDTLHLKDALSKANENISILNEKLEELKNQLALMQRKNEHLQSRLFTSERFLSSDSNTAFHTVFPSAKVFMTFYRFFDEGEDGANIKYWSSSGQSNGQTNQDSERKRAGQPRTLKPIDEIFLAMCRLRQGFPVAHLAHLFNISQPTASRIIITWINYMFLTLGSMNIWPSRKVVDKTMPEAFKAQYSSTRVIIDCTEVRCEMPSSLHLNGELFSSYKKHTTLKDLVGISPGGAITFVSQLYTGSISDREIVIRSGILDLPFNESDSVMADKGFTIEDLLPLGVKLNIPPFLGSSGQMPAEDVLRTQQIASLRIHIERAINKIKNFHIWDGVIP